MATDIAILIEVTNEFGLAGFQCSTGLIISRLK